MPSELSKQSTVVVKGNTVKVATGLPFVDTIAKLAEKYGIAQFTVRMTDRNGATVEVDLYRPPTLVPEDHTILITPYDRPGLSL